MDVMKIFDRLSQSKEHETKSIVAASGNMEQKGESVHKWQ